MTPDCEPPTLPPIGVRDMVRDPWIGFAVLVLFIRAGALGAIAAHLSSSEYGAGLGLLYVLTKAAQYVVDERVRIHRERATGA